MFGIKRKTREEKIIEYRAKIRAWKETWGKITEEIPAYTIEELQELKATLYELEEQGKI